MFLDILVGYEVKIEFGMIRGVVRDVVIFGVWIWLKIRHQIVSLMSLVDELLIIKYCFVFCI